MQEVSRDATLIMGSSITNPFVTYKRKRLFSRSDLHSNTHPEISVSKSSANFNKDGNQISEHILQNKECDIEKCLEYATVEEYILQRKNCDSHQRGQCSEEYAPNLQRLYSACPEQQDFPISKCNRLEQEIKSQNFDGKQGTFHPNNIEEKSSNAQSNPLFVNSGSEQNCEKEVSILAAPDARSFKESDMSCSKVSDRINCSCQMDTCISGTVTSEETNKINEDQHSSLCNNSDTNGRLSGNLITYHRKSKRKRNVSSECPGTSCASETRLAGNTLIVLKDGKKPQEDVNDSRTSPVPAMEIAIAVQMDDPLHFPPRTAKSTPSATSRDIDCNLPPVSGLDENYQPGPSEIPPNFPGLTRNAETVQAESRDKGKSVAESMPASTGISSENKYLQLFPEKSSGDTTRFGNDQEMSRLNGQACYNSGCPWPPGAVQLNPRGTLHDLVPPAPAPDQVQSFARQRMTIDNILNRARATRGNRTILPDTLQPLTLWSEAELDCLWIGVRRHGRGNWDAILRDHRLQFSAWKMPRDLADKWQEEQSRVFHTTPFSSQVRYANPNPNWNPFPSGNASSVLVPQVNGHGNGPVDEVQLSLRNPYCGIPNGHFYHLMNTQKNPVRNSGALSSHGFNPSDFHAVHRRDESSPGPGGLPHWLREAVETPLGVNPSLLFPGVQWPNQLDGRPQQPLLDNRYTSTERRNKPRTNSPAIVRRARNGTRNGAPEERNETRNGVPEDRNISEPDGLIVIPSDASSEETISDDH